MFNKTLKKPSISEVQEFYKSSAWKSLRVEAIIKYNNKCSRCNNITKELTVKHINSLYYSWSSRLNINNLRLVCSKCFNSKDVNVIKLCNEVVVINKIIDNKNNVAWLSRKLSMHKCIKAISMPKKKHNVKEKE